MDQRRGREVGGMGAGEQGEAEGAVVVGVAVISVAVAGVLVGARWFVARRAVRMPMSGVVVMRAGMGRRRLGDEVGGEVIELVPAGQQGLQQRQHGEQRARASGQRRPALGDHRWVEYPAR